MATQRTKFVAASLAAVALIAVVVVAVVLMTAPTPLGGPGDQSLNGGGAGLASLDDTQAPLQLVYPLTGKPADNEAEVLRRPLSVKIENTPEARPQLGMGAADVVYETITEGGITRFNCVFQSTVPPEVGPVRSGRNSDVSLVPQYDALFFMSGANSRVLGEIADAGLADMSHNAASALYYRVDYRAAPHNLYLRFDDVYTVAESKGYATALDRPRRLEFGEPDLNAPGFSDASSVTVPFSDWYVAEWSWDASTASYRRSMDGPSLDAADNQQLAATNVVVLWTPYTPLNYKQTSAVSLNGSGEARVFVGGKQVSCTWSSDGTTPPRFAHADGSPVKLAPGTTFFQVLDVGQPIYVS
ncbi:MAG: DUF3048 domain-containing protein [Coriobacteriales bacterium]|jgi:hypothetical protein|nr:DUF3048 domain-containing protein [Coriobacteriales bacterium]